MFYPDAMKKLIIAEEDADALVIQLYDGSAKFTINRNGNLKLLSPTRVDVVAPLSKFDGDISCTGTITGDIDVIAGNISGKTHTHGGVQTGGGNTDEPNP